MSEVDSKEKAAPKAAPKMTPAEKEAAKAAVEEKAKVAAEAKLITEGGRRVKSRVNMLMPDASTKMIAGEYVTLSSKDLKRLEKDKRHMAEPFWE